MAATRALCLIGRRARLIETRLGGEVAPGELCLPVEIPLGIGQHRLCLGEVGLDPRDLLRPLAELEVGELRAGASKLSLRLGHGGVLLAVLQAKQQGPGLDPIPALHRHLFQPARGWRAQTDILALGIAVQPALVGAIATGTGAE